MDDEADDPRLWLPSWNNLDYSELLGLLHADPRGLCSIHAEVVEDMEPPDGALWAAVAHVVFRDGSHFAAHGFAWWDELQPGWTEAQLAMLAEDRAVMHAARAA